MPGTERVRHCGVCDQNVYNLSEMTRREAEALVESTGGKLCARIYRRPDGGILTKNCPAGIRALSAKLARRVSFVMSALLGWAPAIAQQPGTATVRIEQAEAGKATVYGTVSDATRSPIGGTTIVVTRKPGTTLAKAVADQEGRYRIETLAPGDYEVTLTAPGFISIHKPLTVPSNQTVRLDATLQVGAITMGGPIFD
jgi:hypothetical protein